MTAFVTSPQRPPTRPRRLSPSVFPAVVACLLTLLAHPATAADESESEGTAQADSTAWTDERIVEAVRAGCDASHQLHRTRSIPRSFDVPGPLWLAEPGDERARGVVLPTFLRLFLYGRHNRCHDVDLDAVRPLAGPETWVVLWRTETPHRGRSRPRSDQKVLRPTEVRLRSDGAWHHPVETRASDRWANSWYDDDWNDEESLLAVFDELPKDGSLFVDYDVEEGTRSYLKDSAIYGLAHFDRTWWALAHGAPKPDGGSWWKR